MEGRGVRLCRLGEANAARRCVGRGVFGADGKTFASCAALRKSGRIAGLCPAPVLRQGGAEPEEGGQGAVRLPGEGVERWSVAIPWDGGSTNCLRVHSD